MISLKSLIHNELHLSDLSGQSLRPGVANADSQREKDSACLLGSGAWFFQDRVIAAMVK